MFPRDITSYGAPASGYTDAAPIANPEAELSAASANRLLEDTAQLTRTCVRAHIKFTTNAGGTVAVVSRETLWGDTIAYDPTIARTGAGIYLVTFPTEFTDGLGVDETLSFKGGWANIDSASQTGFTKVVTINAVTFEVRLLSTAAAASDLGGACNIDLFLV